MQYLFVLSRIVFGGFFLYSAYGHAVGNAGMVGYAKSKGVPFAGLLVPLSGLLLLMGGAGILLWFQVQWAVLAIELFLIPVSFYMHPFWKDADANAKMMDRIQFTKNMALAGAALAFLFIDPSATALWPAM